MEHTVLIALLSFAGTLIGTLGGILAANRLTKYRIEQLEKKVDKHNSVIERTYKIEEHLALHDEKIAVANHRIDDLEKERHV